MRIDVLFVPDCPNRATARDRLHAALRQAGATANVFEVEVATVDDAVRLGMRGSPTILIDGHDPFGDGEPSLACRLYTIEGATEGAPSVALLLDALCRPQRDATAGLGGS